MSFAGIPQSSRTIPGQENIDLESLVEFEGFTEAAGSAHIGIKSCVPGDISNEIYIGAV